MLASGDSLGSTRNNVTGQLELLTFARLLWELFRALIFGVLDTLKTKISAKTIELIKQKINISITTFLDQALQLDSAYVRAELKAEKIGIL